MNDQFKKAIKAYLDNRAANDELFAKAYAKSNKSIDECCTYIMGEAKKKAKNGCAAIDDATVFGWAVHYYDEDNIKVNNLPNKAAVQTVNMPEKDLSTEKKEMENPKKKTAKPKKDIEDVFKQLSLFGE